MSRGPFTPQDLRQLADRGITPDEAQRQLELLISPPAPSSLERSCTVGDGLRQLDPERHEELLARFETAVAAGRVTKFVPASGAASRMFQRLEPYLDEQSELKVTELEKRAGEGEQAAADLLAFCARLTDFAFWDALPSALRRTLRQDLRRGSYRRVLVTLLSERGLSYAKLPKALLPFHRYPRGSRTALEEHLAEGLAYARDAAGTCRLHFTVPAHYEEPFRSHLETAGNGLPQAADTHFEIALSLQSPATDTLAATLDHQPFRCEDGRLLLRPSGHGALLCNLQELGADLVFIKNIDNVVPDHRRGLTVRWKKILGGYLVELQERIFALLARLHSQPADDAAVAEALGLLREHFFLDPATVPADAAARRAFARERLDRPLRVCGMVPNSGQPGGGPFWVAGELAPQIVEAAQIDLSCPRQRQIMTSATHFNPVDLVCGLLDWQGRPFDLQRFVDPRAVFITRKSHRGQALKALERPGLWNGSMAYWNTVFVEVPAETFAPVKTVFDLLKTEHR